MADTPSTPSELPHSAPTRASIPTGIAIFAWGTLLLVIVGFLGLASYETLRNRFLGPMPMVYGIVPPIELETHTGIPYSHQDFKDGKTFQVVNFIFTRCGGQCPLMTASMAEFQKHVIANDWANVRLVSISVDPDYDTTTVLKRYGERFGADFRRWVFLRGPAETLYPWANRGLMLATEPNPGGSLTGGEEFVHSNKFVLIDPKGQIRGYFTGTDPEEVNRLKDELGRLRLAGKGA